MRLDPGRTALDEAALLRLVTDLGVDPHGLDSLVTLAGEVPMLPSPLRIAEAASLALAGQAAAVSALHAHRGGSPPHAWIDPRDAVFALNPFGYLRRNGRPSGLWQQFDTVATRGHFRTADDRHIYFVNLAPRNRDGMLRVLRVANDREAVARAVRQWKADDLETAMTGAGVPAAVVRTSAEWRASGPGQLLAAGPLVPVAKLGDADPVPLPPAPRPLDGVKVLDLTHVVAGPTITRGLAEYGADVLHVSTLHPDRQDALDVTMQLLIGKRSAAIELDDPTDRRTFEGLIRQADVFVQSWRPGVLARHGFPPERLAELNPGLVQVSVSAYGERGPWGHRGGFDGLALASIGATAQEAARAGRPKLSPPGVLTDSLVGFAGVGVVAALLMRRAVEGGSYRADLALARFGMWLQELGELAADVAPTVDLGAPRLRRVHSCFGTLDYVAPPIRYSGGFEPYLARPPVPVGSSRPEWGVS